MASKRNIKRQTDDPFLCADDTDCGHGAECVTVKAGGVRECMCVMELKYPDEKTGDCNVTESIREDQINVNGIPHEKLLDILFPNMTSNRVQKERPSSSPQSSTSANIPLFAFVPLACSLAAIIVIVVILCRRHSKTKTRSSTRTRTAAIRNTEGELLLERMSHVNKNQIYFQCPGAVPRKTNVKEINQEHLTLHECIGEGAFGQVFKGDLYCPVADEHLQVAVKILKEGANVETKGEFEKEVEIMSTFDHDNILSLRGIIAHGPESVPFMVFDYMEHGDLSEILRSSDSHHQSKRNLSLNKMDLIEISEFDISTDLVEISVQIACGMSYLASQRFVHRDLATRNCLMGKGMVVKISDFGMSRDVYTNDYYRLGGCRMLPVRWMSPEAIKFGRFAVESDIWAYGVVLWEIFSGGKQPYYGHANEEVVHFLDQGILLQRSEDCPSTIYHVMLGCWKQDPRERTSFDRLFKHLTDYRELLENGHSTGQRKDNSVSKRPTSEETTALLCEEVNMRTRQEEEDKGEVQTEKLKARTKATLVNEGSSDCNLILTKAGQDSETNCEINHSGEDNYGQIHGFISCVINDDEGGLKIKEKDEEGRKEKETVEEKEEAAKKAEKKEKEENENEKEEEVVDEKGEDEEEQEKKEEEKKKEEEEEEKEQKEEEKEEDEDETNAERESEKEDEKETFISRTSHDFNKVTSPFIENNLLSKVNTFGGESITGHSNQY